MLLFIFFCFIRWLGIWKQSSILKIQIQLEMCKTCLRVSFLLLYKCTLTKPEKTSRTHPRCLLSYLACQQATEVTETNSATICSGFEFGENISTNKHLQANRQANTQIFLNTLTLAFSLIASTHVLITFISTCKPSERDMRDVNRWMNNSQHSWNVYLDFHTDVILLIWFTHREWLIWHTDPWGAPLE